MNRAERRHRTESAAHRQAEIARSHGNPVSDVGRFRKHHALDCGVADCGICRNPRKDGEVTIQELKMHDAADDAEISLTDPA